VPRVLLASLALDLDITYILVLALLLIPLLVLNTFVFGPFMKLFEQRHERLTGALERATKRLEEAEKKALAFQEKIQVASAKGMEVRNRLRADAQQQMNARIEAERQRLASKLETALAEVASARSAALVAIEEDAQRLAEQTASKLLGRTI
jgi:F-type H+-transporting ATPase subunit b